MYQSEEKTISRVSDEFVNADYGYAPVWGLESSHDPLSLAAGLPGRIDTLLQGRDTKHAEDEPSVSMSDEAIAFARVEMLTAWVVGLFGVDAWPNAVLPRPVVAHAQIKTASGTTDQNGIAGISAKFDDGGTNPSPAPESEPPHQPPAAPTGPLGGPASAAALEPTPVPTPEAVLLTRYTSGGDAETSYNLVINFDGAWTIALQQAFIDAADYVSAVILADVPDQDGRDDIVISATLAPIDGTGGILGSAGPQLVRYPSFLPIQGTMRFDVADADNYEQRGLWDDIVLHEMLHTMGFGTTWEYTGLTAGTISAGDFRFMGENANAVYAAEFADLDSADGFDFGVPIETDGGSGTAGGHWDEATFSAEIMTGYIDRGNYLSTMTIAALEDMGYDTIFDDPNDPNDLTGSQPLTDPLLVA